RLIGGDQPSAEQLLHVSVIASAGDDRPTPKVIDAAVAHMSPPCRSLLHETYGASGSRALVDWQLLAEPDHFFVRTAQREMQEAQRIEQGMGRLREALGDDLLRNLGRSGAFGMPAHAIDDQQKRRMLSSRYRHTVLVLFTRSDEAEVRVLDSQEEIRASVRLGRVL